jgi:hypothetical protein
LSYLVGFGSRPSPPLVPIPLGGPSDEGQRRSGGAMRVVRDAMVMVPAASMLFNGGSN